MAQIKLGDLFFGHGHGVLTKSVENSQKPLIWRENPGLTTGLTCCQKLRIPMAGSMIKRCPEMISAKR